jgi:hypothetical protein
MKREVSRMKKVFAATVFTTLAFALALSLFGAKDASADAVLAPAFRTDGNFITFVTVVNKSTNTQLHWMYRYDDPTVTGNQCYHADGFGKTTQNDMFTVDISNTFDGGKPMPSAVDTTSGSYNIGKGWQGFLTIYSFTGTYPGTPTVENTLKAEIVIANLSTGEAYSYRAANSPTWQYEGGLDDTSYGTSNAPAPLAFGNNILPTAVWHPFPTISTTWYVMVTHADTAFTNPGDPALCSTLSATIAFADASGNPGFFYDINENIWSGTLGKTVDCFAYMGIADFIAPASIPQAANGGWAHVQMIAPAPQACVKGILVYKLESTTSLSGKLNSALTSQMRVDY